MIRSYAKAVIAVAFGALVAFFGGSSAEGMVTSVVYTVISYFVLASVFRRNRPRRFVLKWAMVSGLCLGVLYLMSAPLLQSDDATVASKYGATAMITLASVLQGPQVWFFGVAPGTKVSVYSIPFFLLYVSVLSFCLAALTTVLLPAFQYGGTHKKASENPSVGECAPDV